MKIIRSILIAVAVCAAAVIRAETIELTRQQASDLFVALTRLEPGLSAANTVIVADNLIALRPIVEALDKGKMKADQNKRALQGVVFDDKRNIVGFSTAEAENAATAIDAQIETKAGEVVKVNLERLNLSDGEIEAAKIRPFFLGVIRQHLRPKK